MSSNQLYATFVAQLRQLRPGERRNRIHLFGWFLTGLFLSRSPHLSRIASKMPSAATLCSLTRRLSRLLQNSAVELREWSEPVAQSFLEQAAQSPTGVRLIVDGSKVGSCHQLLMVSLAYRRRALPLVWTWVSSARGHSTALKQRTLLSWVQKRLPQDAVVVVLGDSEFGAVEVLRQLEAWGWHYVLRQKGSHRAGVSAGVSASVSGVEWRTLAGLSCRGKSLWFDRVLLTRQHAHPTNVLLHWQQGQKEAWLLATNLPDARTTLAAYRKRMWIEEMFGDFKKHGCDLEATHLRHFSRLSRLTLAVVLLFVWMVALGAQAVKRGQRRLVDRNDRRDLSLFRIGWNTLERLLAQQNLPKTLVPIHALPKLSGR